MNYIYYRCDASYEIGLGHVMRCLSIAKYIQLRYKVKQHFITSYSNGNIIKKLINNNLSVSVLPKYEFCQNYDTARECDDINYRKFESNDIVNVSKVLNNKEHRGIIIVDHYLLGYQWQKYFSKYFNKVIVIDDLLTTKHYSNLIIDPNIRTKTICNEYSRKFKYTNKIISGENYVIIISEFLNIKKKIIDNIKREILIMFGGGNNSEITMRALKELLKLKLNLNINVVINKKDLDIYKNTCLQEPNVKIIKYNDNIHKVMQDCDIAIGALGTTTWERCFLGIPTIVYTKHINQNKFIEYLSNRGIIFSINNITQKEILNGLKHFNYFDELFYTKRNKLSNIFDGMGLKRISKNILHND